MQKQTTVQHLADETNVEMNFLLRKIRQAGLSQTRPQDIINQQDRQKIKEILRHPKKTLRRKRPFQSRSDATKDGQKRKDKQARPNKQARQNRHRSGPKQAHPGAQRRRPRPFESKGKQQKQQKSSSYRPKQTKKEGAGKRDKKFAPPPRLSTAHVLRAAPSKTSKTSKIPKSKEKKAYQKAKVIKELIDREEKARKRFGVLISEEDVLEMEEIKRKQRVQDAHKVVPRPIARGKIRVKNVHKFIRPTQKLVREVQLTDDITVADLAHQLGVKSRKLLQKMNELGFQTNDSKLLDKETAVLIVEELGHRALVTKAEEWLLGQALPAGADYQPRPAIITVMGHVDHGKTTLLDYIRKSRQVEKEAGQITQHLGAYKVAVQDRNLTFLDTPGHAAFVEMRLRGAQLTDIVVLVVAADDGVMPQTQEAIRHIQAANTAAVVAINKIDKVAEGGVNIEKVRKEVSALGLAPEEWGGKTPYVEISAITGKGIDHLLETLLVVADVLELKAAANVPARGRVIESRLDKNMGPIATLLIEHGELSKGDIVCCENFYGKLKMIFDDTGKGIQQASPSDPVEVLGLNGVPQAGDRFVVAASEKDAKQAVDWHRMQAEQGTKKQKVDFAALMESSQQQKITIKLIVKADFDGSLAAINQLIGELEGEEVNIKVVSQGVGAINLSDVQLAQTTDAIIVGFNVRSDSAAKKQMKQQPKVDVHYFSVIYELAKELERVVEDKTDLLGTEKIIGIAQVKQVFSARTFGQIAGCEVIEGIIFKDKPIRVLRDNTVIYEGKLESLRRFKDDVNEVHQGVECGIGVKDYKNVKPGDQIEVYDKRNP